MKFPEITVDSGSSSDEALRRIEGSFPVFAPILGSLPKGTTLRRASDHGSCCSWFRTGRIEGTQGDGQRVQYFVKYASGPLGRRLLQAEYESQAKMYELLPEHVPRPLSWGSLELLAPLEGHYFLTEFVEFHDPGLPDVESAGALVAKLHAASVGTSQQFGTPIPLFDGMLNYINGWEPTWPRMFARILFQMYHYNCLTNGLWDDLHAAILPIIQIVLPRLLNELERGERCVEPTFIHGDLWNGNFGLANDTNKLYLFDSSGYYAHHEMEFAYWKTLHHRMHERDYCGAYFRQQPPSEPAEEFEDRVLLYTLKPLLLYSSMNPGHVTRERALHNMNYLLQKYQPTGDLQRTAELPFQDVVSGEQLWVKQYSPDIAAFIGARKRKIREVLPPGRG